MADVMFGPSGRGRPDGARRRWSEDWTAWASPALAAVLALTAGLLGWRGVDLPAQLYRVGLFHRDGLTLWDSQWYGGHWTLGYSVVFAPIAGIFGVQLTEIMSVALAALAFDRLVMRHFGPTARLGSLAFALGTLVQVGIGQVPFLVGEAAAMAAYWAATRGRCALAAILAMVASLASPEAGAFLALVAAASLVVTWPRRRASLVWIMVAAAVPVAATATLFPGQGSMPFPAIAFAAEGAVFLAGVLAIPRTAVPFRVAAGLYLVVFVGSFALPSPVGGNIGRLGETLGVPLACCLLWPLRRWALALVAVPMAVLQWAPAVTAVAANRSNPAAQPSYFDPLVGYVESHDQPAGRVEIVPTALHWEATYAAPALPLARGWERQLDTVDNPIFYTKGALSPSTYRAWLVDNGVRFVALPDVKLDYAAVAEGSLVRAGVAGLTMVWHDQHWRVYSVAGSHGLVDGPARLDRLSGGEIDLQVTGPGRIHIKERYSPSWAVVQGAGCPRKDAGGWLAIDAMRAGPLRVEVRLVGPSGDPC
jgi:hypothetical protein